MERPIIDPPTPFLGAIPGGFDAGKMARIQGYVSPVGERININFQTGENIKPRDDVGLHISIRLLEGYIARNSLQGGMWGDEQDAGDLPIQPGQKFEIIVLSDKSQYKIAVNGKHYCEFPQRFPADKVTHLAVDGDVSIALISYESDIPQDAQAAAPPPSQATYGPPPSAPAGPPGGFAPQSGYDPQRGYGPQPDYGPQPGYGPPPPGQYQPPMPPGHEQHCCGHCRKENKESELGSFLETAGTILAGAYRSGAADKLISSFSGGGANQQQPAPPQQNQGGLGSLLSSFTGQNSYPHPQQSQGGDVLSGLGSLLSSFGGQQSQPQPTYAPPSQSGTQGGDILSGLGSLISNYTSQNQQPAPPQPQPPLQSAPAQSGGTDIIGGLGSLLSNFASQNQQPTSPPQPQPPPQQSAQSGGADILGGLSSLLSTLSTHPQPQQPALNPSQLGGHGSVGGLGSMTPILSSLADQIITTPKEDGKH